MLAYRQLSPEFYRIEQLVSRIRLPSNKVGDLSKIAKAASQLLLDVLQSPEPGSDKGLITKSLSIEVAESMRVLGEKERELLTLFFGLGDGQHLGIKRLLRLSNGTQKAIIVRNHF